MLYLQKTCPDTGKHQAQMVFQGNGTGSIPTLAPRLHKLFADFIENMTLTPSMYQAHVILILKPGKYRSHCASYRPISLINYDLKILTTILATRLMQILPNLLSIDQNQLYAWEVDQY